MPEDWSQVPEEELLDFAELVRSVPPWEPDPDWFAQLKAKLMAAELPEPGKGDSGERR